MPNGSYQGVVTNTSAARSSRAARRAGAARRRSRGRRCRSDSASARRRPISGVTHRVGFGALAADHQQARARRRSSRPTRADDVVDALARHHAAELQDHEFVVGEAQPRARASVRLPGAELVRSTPHGTVAMRGGRAVEAGSGLPRPAGIRRSAVGLARRCARSMSMRPAGSRRPAPWCSRRTRPSAWKVITSGTPKRRLQAQADPARHEEVRVHDVVRRLRAQAPLARRRRRPACARSSSSFGTKRGGPRRHVDHAQRRRPARPPQAAPHRRDG